MVIPCRMLVTRQSLLDWLCSVENDAGNANRHNALWDGPRLLDAARNEGLPLDGAQGHLDFTRLIGQLKEDGWITWSWIQWPAGTRDADEPPARFLAAEHLSRIQEIRVLPVSYQRTGTGGLSADQESFGDDSRLEPEQEQLLVTLVEACRDIPRNERTFWLIRTFGGDEIQGGGLASSIEVPVSDLEYLDQVGLLSIKWDSSGTSASFSLTPKAGARYQSVQMAGGSPMRHVEERTRSYLDSSEFQSTCSLASERWREAAALLWAPDAQAQLTTIGHKCREAMQEFASALVRSFDPPNVIRDPTKTLDRVSAVLVLHRPVLGEGRTQLLDALFGYWRASIDLVQRQEHGGQKEGEPLNWEDARRVVFQTANVMVEIHRAAELAARLSKPGA
jgi:hypothetical protein